MKLATPEGQGLRRAHLADVDPAKTVDCGAEFVPWDGLASPAPTQSNGNGRKSPQEAPQLPGAANVSYMMGLRRKQAAAGAFLSPERKRQIDQLEEVLQNLEAHHAKYMNSVTRDLKDIRSGYKAELTEDLNQSCIDQNEPVLNGELIGSRLRSGHGALREGCPSWQPNASELSERKYAFQDVTHS